MSKDICKKCDSFDGTCCQSGFAFPYEIECSNDHCDYFKEKQEQTVFQKLMQSEETLAEKSVYAHECCRIPDGATSPFIDEIFWFDDEKGDTWDERFDRAWEKAKNATVEKLKELCNADESKSI